MTAKIINLWSLRSCWERFDAGEENTKKNNNKEIIDVIFRRNKLGDSGGLKAAIQIELSIMTA